MSAIAARQTILTTDLREDIRTVTSSRVDRDTCVIFGVKICGLESPNTHGMEEEFPEVKGTRYTLEALSRAAPLYENQNVNVNHPDREKPGADRKAEDRIGKLKNVRLGDDGLYGDLYLIPSHVMTESLLDAAEDPALHSCFGLSHNARGKGEIRDGYYTIVEIPEVRSVDVVADPGTNRSLFESKEVPAMKLSPKVKKALARSLKPVMESLGREEKAKLTELLEMGDALADMHEDDAGGAAAGGAGYEDHCAEMVKAIMLDTSLSAEQKIAKIKKALKLLEDESSGGSDVEEDAGDAEGDGRDVGGGKGEKADAYDTKESRRPKRTSRSSNAEVRELQEQLAQLRSDLELERMEKWVREECDTRGLSPKEIGAELLESIIASGDKAKITRALDQVQKMAGSKKPGPKPAPRSQSLTRQLVASLTESKEGKDGDGEATQSTIPKELDAQANWLRN